MSNQDDDIQVKGDRDAMASVMAFTDFPYDEIDRGNPLAAGVYEDDMADAYRFRAKEELSMIKEFVTSIQSYSGDKAFALDFGCLVFGFTALAKAKTFEGIFKKYPLEEQSKESIKSIFGMCENRFICKSADENIIALAKEAHKKRNEFLKKFIMSVLDYRGDKAFALDCACLALGFHDLCRAKTQDELAVRHACHKANVSQCVNHIQFALSIEPMPGQHSKETRSKQSTKRKEQLK